MSFLSSRHPSGRVPYQSRNLAGPSYTAHSQNGAPNDTHSSLGPSGSQVTSAEHEVLPTSDRYRLTNRPSTTTSSDGALELSSSCSSNTHSQNSPKYLAISRPWREIRSVENSTTRDIGGTSPMERWAQERVEDQAWNNVDRVLINLDLEMDSTGKIYEQRRN
ncbi:uncharacterized protein K441DRAFT_110684 [Cenococcum geophilum 1.58]|uniref:uncharacterized protein n=1 Tax=Cenococcum geophilum 1.58 TaxID=794803 RepID=UPI00358E805E|nr:hypothetical protein K441DRAFT_110684 [Cenococcum geophilum 1.58]